MPSSPHEGWNNAPYLPGISHEPGGQTIGVSKKQSPQQTGEDDFSFEDVLDALNPLHHLPVVSTLYRNATGDGLNSLAKLVGGALFFGPIGLKVAAADVAVQAITGSSVEQHVLSLFEGGEAEEGAVSPERQHGAHHPLKEDPSHVASASPLQMTQGGHKASLTSPSVEKSASLVADDSRWRRSAGPSLSHPVSTVHSEGEPWALKQVDHRFRAKSVPVSSPIRPSADPETSAAVPKPNEDAAASSPSTPYVAAKTLEELVGRYAVSEKRSTLSRAPKVREAAQTIPHTSPHRNHMHQAAARYQQVTHRPNLPKAPYSL